MGITYGFYNSVDGDRKYNANQFSSLFDGIINDGVFMSVGSNLIVSADDDMTVSVGSGRAWFNSTWTYNDSEYIITLDQSELILNRIDAIVLEVNSETNTRANTIKKIKGTPSGSPVNPTLTNTGTIHQYPLCYIYVTAGQTQILQGNITNTVGTAACPFVTGILETIDSDVLLAQWEYQFNTWFTGLEDTLDTNTEANLLALIDDGEGIDIDFKKLYNHNVIQILDGTEVWASNSWDNVVGTYSEDLVNYKTGIKGAKLTTSTNYGGIKATKPTDCSKYLDGTSVSSSDFFRFAFKMNTLSLSRMDEIAFIVYLPCDNAPTLTNCYKLEYIAADLVDGWNYIDSTIANLQSVGSPSLANIKGLSIKIDAITAEVNLTIDTLSFCIVRKDPNTNLIPNPFQHKENNTYIADLLVQGSAHPPIWFLGYEFGNIVARELFETDNATSAIINKNFKNFIANTTLISEGDTYSRGISWFVDSGNSIVCFIYINQIYMEVLQGGINTEIVSSTINFKKGSIVNFQLIKDGTAVTLITTIDGVQTTLVSQTTITGSGKVSIGCIPTTAGTTSYLSFSVTSTKHCHHSSKSDWAATVGEGTWEKIEIKVLPADAARVDFYPDPKYKFFKLLFNACSSTSTIRSLNLTLNDIVTGYLNITSEKTGTSNTITSNSDTSFILLNALAIGTSYAGVGEVLISNPAITNRSRAINANFVTLFTGSVQRQYNVSCLTGGLVSPINKISLIASGDNIEANSEFILMGVR